MKPRNRNLATEQSKQSVSEKTRPEDSTDETARQIPPVVQEPYVCSNCGYCTDVKDPCWPDPSIPVWDPKGKKREECWMLCPEDGAPEVSVLTSPDRRAQRWRYGFEFPGGTIHACTPFVVLSRKPDGSCSLGAVMEAAEVIREIKLKQYLESHSPDKEIDLQHLRDAELISNNPHCYRVKDLWLLSLRRSRSYDDWARKAMKLVYEAGRPDTDLLVDKLAAALDPRLDIFRPAWSRILHIPVDLSQPIGTQLERINPALTEIRDYLYRFTTQPPPRDRIEFIWRDVYIFLLAQLAGKSIAQIAEEIFPDAHRKTRYDKVDLIVRKVQKAADRAGVTIPPPSSETKHPT